MAAFLPPQARRTVRRGGGALLRRLPKPVAQEIRGVFGVRWTVSSKPDQLAGRGAQDRDSGRVAPGRAAATPAADPARSARLERMLGRPDLGRDVAGNRAVVGLLSADARRLLEGAGHRVVPMTPGTSVAVAERTDVLVLDLEGFTGVWDGALSTSGVALLLEVLAAVGAAHRAGATCWLIDRGPRRSEIGALLLRRQSTLMPVQPGTPRPAGHHTEDAGDAPTEIADLLRDMEETSRA